MKKLLVMSLLLTSTLFTGCASELPASTNVSENSTESPTEVEAPKAEPQTGSRLIAANLYDSVSDSSGTSIIRPPSDAWAYVSNGKIDTSNAASAFQGGSENDQGLGICQAQYKGGQHGGKAVGPPSSIKCNFSYGGGERSAVAFIYLKHSENYEWLKSTGTVPEGALASGKENETQQYICRGSFQGGTHPGKYVGGKCNIGWGGKEHVLSDFEFLIDSSKVSTENENEIEDEEFEGEEVEDDF